jgi:K+-transporting ATPase ATPase A chain
MWWEAGAAVLTVAIPIGLLYRPLGDYIAWVFTSPKHSRAERGIYRVCGVDAETPQTWRAYLCSLLAFSFVGLVTLYALQRLQPWLPYSLGRGAVDRALAFNTAASFVGNTNWQSYVPESTVGYTVQMAGLAVQMFVTAAVGLGVSMALVRGIASRPGGTVGNFWVDLVRASLRVLLPLSILAALVLLAAGVVENFAGFNDISTLTGGTQALPGGPVASQEAIKMLGTNGGGFFSANSAHPFENPTPWTNAFEVFLLLVIPFALPRTYGRIVGDQRHGYVLLTTMAALFLLVFVFLTWAEATGHGTAPQLAGASLEGKEQRYGVVGSTLFGTATTGTSGGAANSMFGSYTAMGGMVLMLNMMLGEVSPGGVGAGLYAILVLSIITVFLTGLLLGRAPMLLGKRIRAREVKLVSIFVLVMPTLALGGMAITFAIPRLHHEVVTTNMSDDGLHGLSEVMYAFISTAVNNGSAFAGFDANTPWLNVALGIIILLGRFIPITLVLALAGSFAGQDRAGTKAVELPTHRPQFVFMLVAVILVIALPMFLPYLMLGPLAEGLR